MILIIAPHADDEAIGCGGFIRRQTEKGHRVEVSLLTSPTEDKIRMSEFKRSLSVLGAKESACFKYEEQKIELTPESVCSLNKFIEARQPRLLLCPHVNEQDRDHRNSAILVHAALKSTSLRPVPWVLQYEIWTPIQQPDLIINITEFQNEKKKAICEYSTQQRVRNYAEGILGINRYRGVFWGKGDGYFEAFNILTIKDQQSIEKLWLYLD